MISSYGKYQVLEQVGEGGFGRVYRALDPLLKREVAIKTCTLRQPDVRARFVREAEIVASLKHPHIVTIYDFGVEDGEPYLVQEFLSGTDLQVVLDSGAPVDLATKVKWLQQIAAGLLAAHGQNIIHRDIKPSNVRIQSDGDVRIMDFGIAKLLEAEEQLTQTGMSIGTSGYLAPEQLTGQEIDHRVDIFSFGVLAYELLSGRRPFMADNITASLYRIVHEPATPLADLVPDLPSTLARCIMRCLEKDRDQRWASFGPVKGELQEVQRQLEKSPGEFTGQPLPSTTAAVENDDAASDGWRRRLSPAIAGLSLFAVAVALFGVIMVSRTVWGGNAAGTAPIPIEDDVVAATTEDEPVVAEPQQSVEPVIQPPATDSPPARPADATTPPAAPPPSPPPPPAATQPAALDASRLVVFVDAGDAAVRDAAETHILNGLREEGFSIVDATGVLERSPGENPTPVPNTLAALGRTHGAGFVLFVGATSDAVASVGGMFTGSATVQIRVYDSATGDLVVNQRGAVGSNNVPGKLAATPDAARLDATSAAAYQALRGVLREWR